MRNKKGRSALRGQKFEGDLKTQSPSIIQGPHEMKRLCTSPATSLDTHTLIKISLLTAYLINCLKQVNNKILPIHLPLTALIVDKNVRVCLHFNTCYLTSWCRLLPWAHVIQLPKSNIGTDFFSSSYLH